MGTKFEGIVSTDAGELWDRVRVAHSRFAELLAQIDPSTPARNCGWTAHEVAAHIYTVLGRYTERDFTKPEGMQPDREAVARLNEDEIDAVRHVPVPELLAMIAERLDRIEELIPRDVDPELRFCFHGGENVDSAAALANLVGEFLMHGRDVARGARKRWPIQGRDSALLLTLLMQVGPGFVISDPPGDLSVELRTRHTHPWLVDLRDGVLTCRPLGPDDKPDLRMYGRPQAFMLNLYGRTGLLATTLQGAILIGGRRPWRIGRLQTSFQRP